jgi:hypothetical protein
MTLGGVLAIWPDRRERERFMARHAAEVAGA